MSTIFLDAAKNAALKAGELLSENFQLTKKREYKSSHDLISEMDKKSEEIILKTITNAFPDHSYFSEEEGEVKKSSDYYWYIDPLDGTNNYVAGIPYFSVSISLLFKDETILGVVFNPISQQLFSAAKEKGAFLNDNKISPSSVDSLDKSSLFYIRGHSTYDNPKLDETAKEVRELMSGSVRRKIETWAPAMDWCLVAAGGVDALVSFESELEDQYAGTLIAQEAGVSVVSFGGVKYNHEIRRIIAANKYVSKKLVELLSSFKA